MTRVIIGIREYEVRRSSRLSRKKLLNYSEKRPYNRKTSYRRQQRKEKQEIPSTVQHNQDFGIGESELVKISIHEQEVFKKMMYYCERCYKFNNNNYCDRCENKLYRDRDFDVDDIDDWVIDNSSNSTITSDVNNS